MKRVIIFSLFATLLVSHSCVIEQVKNISQLASLGLQVVNLLKSSNELGQIFSKKVAEVNSGMEEGIKSNKSTLELGKYWEKYWGDIHSDYDEIRNKLYETDRVSQQYFAELAANNGKMNNPDLKTADMNKNVKLAEEYKKEFEKALVSLSNAEKLLKDGDDIMLALRNDVLRSALQSQITVLKDITIQSNVLSQNINSFSKTCIPIFTQNN